MSLLSEEAARRLRTEPKQLADEIDRLLQDLERRGGSALTNRRLRQVRQRLLHFELVLTGLMELLEDDHPGVAPRH